MSATQQESKMFSEAKCRFAPVKTKRRWISGIAYVGEFLDSLIFPLESVLEKAKSFTEKYQFE